MSLSIISQVVFFTSFLLCVWAMSAKMTRDSNSDNNLRDLKEGLGVFNYTMKNQLQQSLPNGQYRPLLYKAVSEISQLIYLQKQVQEVISQEDSVNEQLLVTSVVLNATLQEACHWLNYIISTDYAFTCTEEKLYQIKLITTARDIVNKLDINLGQNDNINHCQWVECNLLSSLSIPTDIKQYIIDNGYGFCKSIDVTDITTFKYYPENC